VLDWIDSFLENNPEDKLLIYGIHRVMINAVLEHYAKKKVGIVSITGDTKMEDRQMAVERIQNDPNTKLFVGNIVAAGTGLTMTRAAYTLFMELDFVPSNHLQAECRNYRIGQNNPVFWYYFVVKDTIEERVVKILMEKQNTFNSVIDGQSENNDTFKLLRDYVAEIRSRRS